MAALAAERYLSEKGLLREVHQPKDDLERTAKPEGGEVVTMQAGEASKAAAPVAAAVGGAEGEGEGGDTYFKGEEALNKLMGCVRRLFALPGLMEAGL